MPVTVIVFLSGVMATLIFAATTALTRGGGPVDPQRAEHWLIVHTARHPRLNRLSNVVDRRVIGGIGVALSGLAIWLAALSIGWLFDSIDENRGFARFDQAVAEWGAEHATSTSTTLLRLVTHLGDTIVVFLVMIFVAILDYAQRRTAAVIGFLATVGIGVSLLNNGLKWLVERERPPVEHLVSAGGASFPSGHSAAAAAGWAAIALVLERTVARGRWPLLVGASGAIAIMVAASRALLGVHWLTDILAGVIVGWTWFFLVAVLFGGRILRLGDPAERVDARLEGSVRADQAGGQP